MKKNFLAIAAIILVAGAVTIVACTKDNPINNTQNAQPIQQTSSVKSNDVFRTDEITIAEWTKDKIKLLFNKQKVLSNIQTKIKESLDMNCIMEDIKISIYEFDKEEVPILSISYFDLDEEKAVTMYGVLKRHTVGSSSTMLSLPSGGISARCIGSNCGKGCDPVGERNQFGELIIFTCSPCYPKDPQKPYSCSYTPGQELISSIVFECIRLDIK